jgi:3-isopropylmalate dehydrogenase
MSSGRGHRVAIIPGDGIGPEVMAEARSVLEVVTKKHGLAFDLVDGIAGGAAIDEFGDPLPPHTLQLCRDSDAVLFGAGGGPKWDGLPIGTTPEFAAVRLRQELHCFANLRFVRSYPSLADAIPLKRSVIGDGVDMVIVRELSEDIYYGKPRYRRVEQGVDRAVDTAVYTAPAVERVARFAFSLAGERRGKVTLITKSNIMATSRLFRDVATRISGEFPDIDMNHELVDAASMKIVLQPQSFDVILTTNQFGDILGDEAAVLVGSLGLIPSVAISSDGVNFYEPVHGSAPDIAGRGIANPAAAILSVALMLRHSFDRPQVAGEIEGAVERVLEKGTRTAELWRDGYKRASTKEFGALVCREISGHTP